MLAAPFWVVPSDVKVTLTTNFRKNSEQNTAIICY